LDCIADAAFGIACFARLAFGFFARSRACGAGNETSSSQSYRFIGFIVLE